MPKVTWYKGNRPKSPTPIKHDYIKLMLTEYMQQRKITYRTLAEQIGGSPDSLRVKKHYGSDNYKLSELLKWCSALDVEETALTDAVIKMYREAKL